MREYRVEELAEAAGLSVEVVRSYQSRGLLPRPRHEGRMAYYGTRHLERLQAIRDLKARGHSLRAIATLLTEDGGPIAVSPSAVETETLTLVDLADRTRVPPAMLRSFEGSGLLQPTGEGPDRHYTAADVRAVKMLLALLGGGVPMEELMAVAKGELDSLEALAQGAVDLFMRYIREPMVASHVPQKEEAERLAASYRLLVQAVTELLTYVFQRKAAAALNAAMEAHGTRSERAAVRRIPA
jgi:DNA-binding transcriptional MerR regulator